MNLSTTEIQEQLNLLHMRKNEILSLSLKDRSQAEFMRTLKKQISPKINNYREDIKFIKCCSYVDAVFEVLLGDLVGAENTEIIMTYLRICARNRTFNSMLSVYAKYRDNLEMRNLILFCSSVYRYKLFIDKHLFQNLSTYRSQMKYSSSCENCGTLAYELAIQMKKLNFI
jgi:hypothetical protein